MGENWLPLKLQFIPTGTDVCSEFAFVFYSHYDSVYWWNSLYLIPCHDIPYFIISDQRIWFKVKKFHWNHKIVELTIGGSVMIPFDTHHLMKVRVSLTSENMYSVIKENKWRGLMFLFWHCVAIQVFSFVSVWGMLMEHSNGFTAWTTI